MFDISHYSYSLLLYIELSNSFLIGQKRTVNFRNQRPWRYNCRLYNNRVKDTQGHGLSCHVWTRCMISKGNHVKFARFVLLAVSEEAKTWLQFVLVQCIIKQLLDSVFVISRIIKVSVRVISLAEPSASADNPYLDLDYSGYHKNLIQELFVVLGLYWLVQSYIS